MRIPEKASKVQKGAPKGASKGTSKGASKGAPKGASKGVKKTGVKKTDTCKRLTHAPYSHPKATRAARS